MFEFLMLLALSSAVFSQLLPPRPSAERENRRQEGRIGAIRKNQLFAVVHLPQTAKKREETAGRPGEERTQGAASLLWPGF